MLLPHHQAEVATVRSHRHQVCNPTVVAQAGTLVLCY
ncbi:uncharacterized protein N7458_009816, partial [Penicillium daleae]